MWYFFLVAVFYHWHNLYKNLSGLMFWKNPSFIQVTKQLSTFTKTGLYFKYLLCHDIESKFIFINIIKANNIGMSQLLQKINFFQILTQVNTCILLDLFYTTFNWIVISQYSLITDPSGSSADLHKDIGTSATNLYYSVILDFFVLSIRV